MVSYDKYALHPHANMLRLGDLVGRKGGRVHHIDSIHSTATVKECVERMKLFNRSCLAIVKKEGKREIGEREEEKGKEETLVGFVTEDFLFHHLRHLPFAYMQNTPIISLCPSLPWLQLSSHLSLTEGLLRMVNSNTWHAVVEMDTTSFLWASSPNRAFASSSERGGGVGERGERTSSLAIQTLGDIAIELTRLQKRFPPLSLTPSNSLLCTIEKERAYFLFERNL
jgi:hypothetical protein